MIPTRTRRPGRLRAVSVAAALAVSMFAGVAAPAAAATADDAPQLRSVQIERPGDGGGFTPMGWSWF